MGLLVSNCANPCQCATCFKFAAGSNSSQVNPNSAIFNPPTENFTDPSSCCNGKLWFLNGGNGTAPVMQAYQPVGGGPILGNQPFTFTVKWGGKTVLTETGVAYWDVTTKPITFEFSDPGWLQNNPETGWGWYETGIFDDASPISMTLDVPNPLGAVSWPVPMWYSCPTCVDVSSVGTPTGGDECLIQWVESEVAQRTLIQPGNCHIEAYFTSAGIAAGTFAGFTIEELYSRVLGSFTYTYQLTLDGVTIINQTANLNPPSFTADIVFSNAGWYAWGGVFRLDYSGPISVNPTVVQTFSLNQQRCLYRPRFCISAFASTS